VTIDENKLMDFLNRFVSDLGATAAAGNVVIGDRLGLYRAPAERPHRPADLAARCGTAPRYVEEWLRGQAAGGYVQYQPADDTYWMSEEQAFAVTDPDGPVYAGSSWWAHCVPSRRSPTLSAAGRASAGTSTTRMSSPGASGSSGPATAPT
jgi:hypothetical protein